jgi:hypothetical protein
VLAFRSAPDHGNPADMDGDNVYEVTVEADDGTYMDTQDVTVTVTDVEQEVAVDPVEQYDANGDSVIDRSEALNAVGDFFDNQLSRDDALAVVAAFFG